MLERARVLATDDEAAPRLAALGLSVDLVRNAVTRGFIARTASTAFDPPSYPGYEQWAKTHRALRELLVPGGWCADDAGGFSTVVSADGSTAITVATGDDRTGLAGLPHPSTKYPRGPMTQAAVKNNTQLALPGLDLVAGPASSVVRVTWILLIHTRHDGVRYELSRPKSIGTDGRVDAWEERILVSGIATGEVLPFNPDLEAEAAEIDVPVEPL